MDGERGFCEVAELVDGSAFILEVCDHLFGHGGGVCGDIFLADAVFSCEDEGMDYVEFGRGLFLPYSEVFCDLFEFAERLCGFCEGLFACVCLLERVKGGGG